MKEVVQNVHNLVQDAANPLVASSRRGRVIRKLQKFMLLGESLNILIQKPLN